MIKFDARQNLKDALLGSFGQSVILVSNSVIYILSVWQRAYTFARCKRSKRLQRTASGRQPRFREPSSLPHSIICHKKITNI
ncbi:MAG: hypothetical protein CRN43_21930 [Candidatus Nephrothrix sp. EaCA]|nr:MAG: hypothetical protein CRN43_21930 [Candidatus Nephrothrix sp. EaCA]